MAINDQLERIIAALDKLDKDSDPSIGYGLTVGDRTLYIAQKLEKMISEGDIGGDIDPEVIAAAVAAWIEDHPEAVTTVQDGAISYAKLDSTLKGKADDVSELKTAIGEVTRKTRNLFDKSVLNNVTGITLGDDGYYQGKVSAWAAAFGTEFPFGVDFEANTAYNLSYKYYFSDVGSYTGGAISFKYYYTDETSGNFINMGASATTSTDASQHSYSSKTLDYLKMAVTDARANNYILHIKDMQLEKGESATPYVNYRTAYDIVAEDGVIENANAISGIENTLEYYANNSIIAKWEIGFYNGSGQKQTSTTAVRTKELIHLLKGTKLFVDTNYMYRMYRYSQNSLSSFVEYYGYSYDSSLHYITGYYVVPYDAYYNFVVTDYSSSTFTDATAIGNHLHILPSVALNSLKDEVSLGIMPYNLAGLKTYIDSVNGMHGDVVLPIVTDIHGGYPDTYAVINYLANSGIGNYMFELGDVIKATYPTRAEAVAYIRDSFHTMAYTRTNTPIIMLQGNHDTNPLSGKDTTKNVTQETFYGLSMARTKDLEQPVNKGYGYVDIEAAKVRVIYLNTSDIYDASTGDALVTGQYTMIQQGQLDWIQNTALNLSDKDTPTDWAVIIMSHDSLSQIAQSMFSALLTAFTSGTSATGTYSITVSDYTYSLALNCDFTEQGAIEVICEVNGHHHKDMIRELGTTGIKQVYVACEGPASASYDDDGDTAYYDRIRGTTDEHLIDTLVLDKANKTVYFKRFGVGSDRSITYGEVT